MSSMAMQSSSISAAQPEAILEWLHKEMGYRPLGQYSSSSSKSHLPPVESIRKICRGNMIPIWNFLLNRVKSEKTVESIRRNITVHGGSSNLVNVGKEEGRSKSSRRKEKSVGEISNAGENREAALQDRELAAKEVERLRNMVRRQRKDLRTRMLEVSKEETERKRMLDERANYRHKQVMLEAYDWQCDEAAKIFAEYHKRLCYHVKQARDARRSGVDASGEVVHNSRNYIEKEAVYSTFKGNKSVDDVVLIETTRERNIRKACESLANHMLEKIHSSFPAYEGISLHPNPQSDASKLGIDFEGQIPEDVRIIIMDCLKSPPQLLQAISAYTLRLKSLISREIEKIDVRADAETLRYKYENNRVMHAASPDLSSPLQYHLYGNDGIGIDVPSGGSQNQLLERQKAHVQQFLATEDAMNKAAEARDLSKKLLKRLHGGGEVISSHSVGVGSTSQNFGALRQFELDVWAKEREVAGLKASLDTLMSEIQRLNKLCAERKEAEDSLKKKWKKIEEFDARRSELETIYNALLQANMDAASFWDQQPLAAREYASSTIIPACAVVVDISNGAIGLIEKEVSAFYQTPDNSLYMLPSTSQGLLEAMGITGSAGQEAVANAEINAAMLTTRAGAMDPSAIPSICRIAAALQYPVGMEGLDAGLASVLESLEFCLKLRGSEASVLEDLLKAINLVYIRRDLVESGHALLEHAYRVQQEYERKTRFCLSLADHQEKTIMEEWLPELKAAVMNAQKGLEECKYVRGLLDEWWEQPASTVVDWVTIDGQNVAAWLNHVKQLLAYFKENSLSTQSHLAI